MNKIKNLLNKILNTLNLIINKIKKKNFIKFHKMIFNSTITKIKKYSFN